MAYGSGQNARLCTAVTRAIREAISVEELIHHHQGRVFSYNLLIVIQVAKDSIFGVGQHFQGRGHRFSPYGPTVSR